MKKLVVMCLVGFLGLSAGVEAKAASFVEVPVNADHLFIPRGFDNNDSVELVVTGFLPNLCHRAPHVRVDRSVPFEIKLQVMAMVDAAPDAVCAQMLYPYKEVVSLGVLPSGPYSIKVMNANGSVSTINSMQVSVAVSTNPDDFVYADVENIKTFPESNRIVLEGMNPSDCFELDRIIVSDNGKDTYSIQPIMHQRSGFCPLKMTDFAYEATLPSTLSGDKILIHVRKMNGKSVNKVLYRTGPQL